VRTWLWMAIFVAAALTACEVDTEQGGMSSQDVVEQDAGDVSLAESTPTDTWIPPDVDQDAWPENNPADTWVPPDVNQDAWPENNPADTWVPPDVDPDAWTGDDTWDDSWDTDDVDDDSWDSYDSWDTDDADDVYYDPWDTDDTEDVNWDTWDSYDPWDADDTEDINWDTWDSDDPWDSYDGDDGYDDVIGTYCWDEGSCPSGYTCVEIPCPDCGVMPESVCVPEPCGEDGCFTDAHCAAGRVCVGEEFWSGHEGRCLDAIKPPRCWENEDCPSVAYCGGMSYCPPCVDCGMVEAAGTCEPNGGVFGAFLTVDDDFYQPYEALYPVWYNFTNEPIYLGGCTTYSLEVYQNNEWINLGPPAVCVWEGVAKKVMPGDAYIAMDYTLPQPPDWSYGLHRVRGGYSTGCDDGQPISSGCQGEPLISVSETFYVGYAE
jgi:hypothetical protein